MKNWADHCSSDEESLTEEVAAELEKVQVEDEVQQEEEQIVEEAEPVDHVQPEVQEPPPPVEKTYNFPSQPPFTAFIGNLAYSVDDGEKLKEALGDVIADRLGPGKVNVLNGRIATDRQSGRHRGFGYVEVETVDQLKLLMEINDGQSQIAGRQIQLDTATARRDNNRRNSNKNDKRSSGGSFNVDGSKFRGGRFNRGGSNNNDPPAQRTSLKLAPRSKPREGEGNGSSSDIFGGAKARDEGAWEKKKLDGGDRRRNSQNKSRGGGRGGGKGRNEAGRGGGGNKNKKNNRRDSKPQESSPKAEQAKPPASKPEPAKSATAAKKAPANSFALLMDSDSE